MLTEPAQGRIPRLAIHRRLGKIQPDAVYYPGFVGALARPPDHRPGLFVVARQEQGQCQIGVKLAALLLVRGFFHSPQFTVSPFQRHRIALIEPTVQLQLAQRDAIHFNHDQPVVFLGNLERLPDERLGLIIIALIHGDIAQRVGRVGFGQAVARDAADGEILLLAAPRLFPIALVNIVIRQIVQRDDLLATVADGPANGKGLLEIFAGGLQISRRLGDDAFGVPGALPSLPEWSLAG